MSLEALKTNANITMRVIKIMEMFISVNCFFLPFLFLFLLLFFFLFSRLIHCRVTNPAKLKLREKTNERKKQERKLWRNVRQGKKQVVIIILYGTNVEEND